MEDLETTYNSTDRGTSDEIIEELEATEEISEETEKLEKSTFKFKENGNGLVLTVHHTVKESNRLVRIRLVVGCFSDCNKHFVTIDCRGTIFVFDLAKKKYWKLVQRIPKACIIRYIPNQKNVYLVGTKEGDISWLDIGKSVITFSDNYSHGRIHNISFPGMPLKPYLAVIQTYRDALLLNLETNKASHSLDFEHSKIAIKFTSFVPSSDLIFTCFTNDAVHIWSGITLNTIRVHNPIKSRDRYLMVKEPQTITLKDDNSNSNFVVTCNVKEYSRGLINSFSFSADGLIVCFTTVDSYLLILSSVTYASLYTIKLTDATLKGAWLFPKPHENFVLLQTTKNELLSIDVVNPEVKFTMEDSNSFRVGFSKDRELLFSIKTSGEANIYSAKCLIDHMKSTQNCVQLLRTATNQRKKVSVECFDNQLKKMLKRSRLIPILEEYGEYPGKYRNLIWAALLDIPCNKAQFMDLVKMGTHPTAKMFEKNLQLKNTSSRFNLVKIFSCLGHWTKVFGYSDFIPGFIFPFVKVFSNNLNVCFEVIATVLVNHCQLWFEYHPVEPLNYLGICENVLHVFDPQLRRFYTNLWVTATDFAWGMLSTGFSEVLSDENWLSLWDNVLSSPPYFLVFCVVAYHILQREKIFKLATRDELMEFFSEQNPIDMKKFMRKANQLMGICPLDIHPRRYMKEFEKLPKGVYPKFQNYPKRWVEERECQMDAIRKEHAMIDARLRNLECEEEAMLERLELGLKEEEHSRRMQLMQKQYQDILQQEEERLSYQRKILLLYQKELRQKKGKVLELLDKSSQRREKNLKECELISLLKDVERRREQNEIELSLAEEKLKDCALNSITTKYGMDPDPTVKEHIPMRSKFSNEIHRVRKERQRLSNVVKDVLEEGADKCKPNVPLDLNQMEAVLKVLEQEVQNTLTESENLKV